MSSSAILEPPKQTKEQHKTIYVVIIDDRLNAARGIKNQLLSSFSLNKKLTLLDSEIEILHKDKKQTIEDKEIEELMEILADREVLLVIDYDLGRDNSINGIKLASLIKEASKYSPTILYTAATDIDEMEALKIVTAVYPKFIHKKERTHQIAKLISIFKENKDLPSKKRFNLINQEAAAFRQKNKHEEEISQNIWQKPPIISNLKVQSKMEGNELAHIFLSKKLLTYEERKISRWVLGKFEWKIQVLDDDLSINIQQPNQPTIFPIFERQFDAQTHFLKRFKIIEKDFSFKIVVDDKKELKKVFKSFQNNSNNYSEKYQKIINQAFATIFAQAQLK